MAAFRRFGAVPINQEKSSSATSHETSATSSIPVGHSFKVVVLKRFTTLATHEVVRNGGNQPNIIATAVDQMSFFRHYFDKPVRVTTKRARQKGLRLVYRWRSFHANSSMTWP
jgi:hypothetical protein